MSFSVAILGSTSKPVTISKSLITRILRGSLIATASLIPSLLIGINKFDLANVSAIK